MRTLKWLEFFLLQALHKCNKEVKKHPINHHSKKTQTRTNKPHREGRKVETMRITKIDVLEMISERIDKGIKEVPNRYEGEYLQGALFTAEQIKKLVCTLLEDAKSEERLRLLRLSIAGAILGTAALILSILQWFP